jgi:hypothetical protein
MPRSERQKVFAILLHIIDCMSSPGNKRHLQQSQVIEH